MLSQETGAISQWAKSPKKTV